MTGWGGDDFPSTGFRVPSTQKPRFLTPPARSVTSCTQVLQKPSGNLLRTTNTGILVICRNSIYNSERPGKRTRFTLKLFMEQQCHLRHSQPPVRADTGRDRMLLALAQDKVGQQYDTVGGEEVFGGLQRGTLASSPERSSTAPPPCPGPVSPCILSLHAHSSALTPQIPHQS